VVAAAVGLSACADRPAPVAGSASLRVELVTSQSGDASVRLTGLSGAEIEQLRQAALSATDWTSILRVSVADGDGTPVAGGYRVDDAGVDFVPAFPFDPGRIYEVAVDPSRLPQPRQEQPLTTAVSLSAEPQGAPTTVVTAIYPSADVWPENLLRFYLHFSAPMSRTTGVGRVRLVDAADREVADALLPLEADFWNAAATRYTVLFEPGRVKRGIRSNEEMGRALVVGGRYAITVEADWPDATGRPLAASFRHEFTAGPPVEEGLAPEAWEIVAPAAGTQDPLLVRFPDPLDRALLERAIGVARSGQDTMAGAVTVTRAETEWAFTPPEPWQRGPHELVVLSVLEDPAGNRPGQAFEVAEATVQPERTVVPFTIR